MIMNDIISLVIKIVICYITYLFFDKSGFKGGLIFRLLAQLVLYYFKGTLVALYSLGIIYLITTFILIVGLTAIDYLVYKKTRSFGSYVIFGAIAEYGGLFVFTFVIGLVTKLLGN